MTLENADVAALAVAVLRLALAVAAALTVDWIVRRPARERERRNTEIVGELIRRADPRLSMPAEELAQTLRDGKIKSSQLLELYIAQLRKVNPYLNAAVAERVSQAREEAARADQALAKWRASGASREAIPPLLGVPVITKEVHMYPGFPYSMGLVALQHKVANNKNPVLARIERAGAIVLACGNTSEACMWAESANYVHGISRNPYDTSRTPGGSSGGTAALVAALCGGFGITSDVGGSTRIPSLYCGLFGHKPTGGAIPNDRSIPKVHGKVEHYCQLGPCSRSAVDLLPLLKIMAGPTDAVELEGACPDELRHHKQQSAFFRSFDWPSDRRPKRYFVCWEQPGAQLGFVSPRHCDMIAAQEKAVRALESGLKVHVQPVQLDAFKKCFDMWAASLQLANPIPFAQVISEGKSNKISPLWELIKWALTGGHGSNHTLPALALALSEDITRLSPSRNQELQRLNSILAAELNELLGEDGVLLFPSLPTPAPQHGPLPNLFRFADFAACGIFNTLELPATAVPLGLSRDTNMPVGIQVIAANGNDHLSIATAVDLEKLGAAKYHLPAKRVYV